MNCVVLYCYLSCFIVYIVVRYTVVHCLLCGLCNGGSSSAYSFYFTPFHTSLVWSGNTPSEISLPLIHMIFTSNLLYMYPISIILALNPLHIYHTVIISNSSISLSLDCDGILVPRACTKNVLLSMCQLSVLLLDELQSISVAWRQQVFHRFQMVRRYSSPTNITNIYFLVNSCTHFTIYWFCLVWNIIVLLRIVFLCSFFDLLYFSLPFS